jgi:hypothetical protein
VHALYTCRGGSGVIIIVTVVNVKFGIRVNVVVFGIFAAEALLHRASIRRRTLVRVDAANGCICG